MPTDTSEKGLETRTINLLLESGWLPGENQDYNAASCVDLAHLAAFRRTPSRRPPRPSAWTPTTTPAASSSTVSSGR